MRKINNKGMTLIELIISITLMSVVMLFLYRMMANIEYDSDDEYFASQNQEQRMEIIDYIQSYLRNSDYYPTKLTTSGGATPTISITMKKEPSTTKTLLIKVNEGTITIEDSDSANYTRKWNLQKCKAGLTTIETSSTADIQCKQDAQYYLSPYKYTPAICTIKILTTNEDNTSANNNTIDDIVIPILLKE